MKEIPKQYKLVFDDVVSKIRYEVKRITPFIEELGDRLEFDVDKHKIIIRRKDLKDTAIAAN